MLLLLAALAVVFCLSGGMATDVYLSLSSHGQRGQLGLAGFVPETPTVDESKIGRDIQETLRFDLLFSRYFNLLEDGPFYSGQEEQLKNWSEQGADMLICGKIKVKDRQISLTGQLFDIGSKQVIWQKTYNGDLNEYRHLAHELNDDIILRFTGERGIAHTKIVFVNNHTGHKELYVADYDGTNIRQLTYDNSINVLPTWSPDGREIIYTTYRFGNPDLYAISPTGDKLHPISQRQGLNSAGAFSPDGSKIALTLSRGGAPNLFLLSRTGEIMRQLTNGEDIGTSPSFAPNGQEIVYISDKPGYPQLYIMSLSGGNVRRLSARGYCDSPAWSPRGDKIVFAMRENGSSYFDICVYDLPTSRIDKLTQDEGNNENPSWSPDGRFIVFSSTRSGRSEMYVIAVDGSGIRKLGSISGSSFMPDWSQ